MSEPDAAIEAERLLADAHALGRLAAHDDWAVLDRLLAEQMARVQLALRARGLGPVETEALRAELDALEWLRARPAALTRALEEHERMTAARQPPTNGRPVEDREA